MARFGAVSLLLALLVVGAAADCYMHNPPGSNDRNRERNQDRNNADRLFDSQNNAQGGYPWRGDATMRAAPDALTYYSGSTLLVQWTAQHACGPNPDTDCTVILQYASDDGTTPPAQTTNINDWTNLLPGLRDGYPDSATTTQSDNNNAGYLRLEFSDITCTGGDCQQQNQDGTNTIPANGFPGQTQQRQDFYYNGLNGGVQFGMHEGIDYYTECSTTTRNKGLFVADQTLQTNDARATRQNPNAGRRGLECAEERDYYPYWRYSPFVDQAVLTSNIAFCNYFQSNSENVVARNVCDCGQIARTGNSQNTKCSLNKNTGSPGNIPIDAATCNTVGGTWTTDPRSQAKVNLNFPKPDCSLHPLSRDNHLGNAAVVDANGNLQIDPTGQPETASYSWNVPTFLENRHAILRIRYNISQEDYPSMNHALGLPFFDSKNSCPGGVQTTDTGNVDALSQAANAQCYNDPRINVNNRPLYNRPYVQVFSSTDPKLSIALNTHQSGRTFQDRSYVFKVAPRPSNVGGGANIMNLNARGRRGNIVQAYPAVEYDFTPAINTVAQGDYLHIQFHGSDFNQAENANNGEGWQYSDRFNMLQTAQKSINFPIPLSQLTLFQSSDIAKFWGLLGQDPTQCTPFKNGDNNEQNSIENCGKLNRAPNRFPNNPAQGLMQVNIPVGTYTYVSTRNNNFSNRAQKGTLNVTPGNSLSAGAKAAIGIGVVAGVSAAFAGVLFYGKKNPNTSAGRLFTKLSGVFSGGKSTAAPDMEYTRH